MANQLELRGHIIPDDVIEQLCTTLSPPDFLSFVQTCRYLYAFSTSDYIWHKIAGDLPLDVDVDPSVNWRSLPGAMVKALVVKALKLDRNWRRSPSQVTQITKILPPLASPNGAKLLAIIPLGGEWVVAWDAIRTAQVALWRLPGLTQTGSNLSTISPVQVLNLDPEPENTFRVEAVRQEGANDIVLVSIMGVGVHPWDKKLNDVQIYQIDLKGRPDEDLDSPFSVSKPYIVKTWSIKRLRAETAFYYMQIFRGLVVIACEGGSETDATDPSTKHLIIFDTETETTYAIRSPTLSMFERTRMQFKLYAVGTSICIIMAGPYKSYINILVRVLPPKIGSRSHPPPRGYEETFSDFSAAVVDYSLPFSSRMEVHVSPEPTTSSTPIESFALIANTHAFMESPAQETTTVYRFPHLSQARLHLLLNIPEEQSLAPYLPKWVIESLEPILRIPTPVDVTLEAMCLGKTGTRAVWSSRDWNMDEHVLMKAQLALPPYQSTTTSKASENRRSFWEIVSPLQPPSMVFPFQQGACRSLSFDEASGRVFAGLINGEVYVVHFQT